MTADTTTVATTTAATSATDVSPLVGRTRELAAVTELIAGSSPIVTITGPGGVGKSRLATEVAGATRHAGRRAAFVPLAGVRDPGHVLSALVDGLDLSVPPGRTEMDVLVEQLAGTDTLIVVDNLEHVMAAAPLLHHLARACPESALLVTSRAPMRVPGEQVVTLEPLDVPDPSSATASTFRTTDAGALLAQAVAAHDPTFVVTDANAAALAEICVRLDGLPLALELAAARLRLLAPQQMVGLLDRRLDLLKSSARGDDGHHATLRATIGWSVDLLPAELRSKFCALGVFDGGFDLDAAAGVLGLDAGRVGADLDVLAETHLVKVVTSGADRRRFDLLETIREFALADLSTTGRDGDIRNAHADWYCAVAGAAAPALEGSDPTAAAGALAPDLDNFRAAMSWLTSQDDVADTRALQLPADLSRYWWTHGQLAEGGEHLVRAIDSRPWPPSAALAEATRRLGNLLLKAGDMEGGRKAYLQSIAVNERLGDELGLARARSNLGNILSDIGDVDGAEHVRLLALPVLEGAPGYERALASTLNGLAFVALQRGRIDDAFSFLERAIAVLRSVGDVGNVQTVLGNMAEMHAERGDFVRALDAVDEALEMAQAQHDTYETHGYLTDRAEILVTLGRLDEAEAALDGLFSGTDSLSPKQEAAAWCALGALHLAGHRYRSAAEALGRAFEQADGMQHWGVCVSATDRLGLVAGRTGDHASAIRLVSAATARREAHGGTRGQPLTDEIAALLAELAGTTEPDAFAEGEVTGRDWGREEILAAARRLAATAPDERVVAEDPAEALRAAGLTRREAEIALLLAERRTDQEIAETFVVSVRTVTTHVSAVLRKLGVASRRDVRGAITALREAESADTAPT